MFVDDEPDISGYAFLLGSNALYVFEVRLRIWQGLYFKIAELLVNRGGEGFDEIGFKGFE